MSQSTPTSLGHSRSLVAGGPAPLAVAIDRRSAVPLSKQVSDQVRSLIRTGGVDPGRRLPSSRALAADLGVARGVVEQAFDQLLAEGWVVTRRGAGTFVAPALVATQAHMSTSAAPTGRRRGRRGTRAAPAKRPLIRLDSGSPWIDRRHRDGWRRAWRGVAAVEVPNTYPAPAGLPELRTAIAAHVGLHRGFECTPDQVLVTGGTTHALGLILEALGRATIAIEDPGYRAAVATARQLGWPVADIRVDDAGIDVAALRRHPAADIRAVYVTPAHQHPLGMVMSASRRTALLDEAARRDALVVEDDYDSEFRYDVAPLPALAQLGLERVAYLGTASKVVAPGLRIGWLVARPDLVAEVAQRRAARHDHPSWPVQRALLTMFEDGHVARVVRSARRVYAERSRLVRERLSAHGEIARDVAGMYLAVGLSAEQTARVVAAGRRDGFEVPTVADYCRSARRTGIVIGFGGVGDADLERALGSIEGALHRDV